MFEKFFLNILKTRLLCTLYQCNEHKSVSRAFANIYDGVLYNYSYCLYPLNAIEALNFKCLPTWIRICNILAFFRHNSYKHRKAENKLNGHSQPQN